MYGLAEDIDLGFLVGTELIQACFGLHELILNFYKDTSILLTCPYSVDGESQDSTRVIGLLGQRIVKATNHGEGKIALLFSSGGVLVFQDSYPEYESYEIVAPGRHIIV